MTTYLDTSAAIKLLVTEPESAALRSELMSSPRTLVSSMLLHTELHCAAGRRPGQISPAAVNAVLALVTLVDVSRGDLIAAGTHAPLRSNDAIHLATALRLGADEMLTYDRELAAAAAAAGVSIAAPA
ncbi:MAG: type II toxin-antitoxin system VapC family toxin [Micropruina sp.]|uniref:type II toxin-antitoxin system VapC family toxin n=1 Tax=Micropruina sp. TaxID=2737536 RepID=UPI0039E542E6